MNLPKKSNAFTLIELMLVVGIIVIISGAIIPSFSNFIERQRVKQSQEQLKSDLRSVQNRALTGARSDYLIGTSQVRYWGIYFPPNAAAGGPTEYWFFLSIAANSSSCTSAFATSSIQGKESFQNDVIFKSVASTTLGACLFFDFATGSITPININDTSLSLGFASNTTNNLSINFNDAGMIENAN